MTALVRWQQKSKVTRAMKEALGRENVTGCRSEFAKVALFDDANEMKTIAAISRWQILQ